LGSKVILIANNLLHPFSSFVLFHARLVLFCKFRWAYSNNGLREIKMADL